MAIRDVVTRGFGNGTYDPGVNDVPVRGFSIGVVTTTIAKLVAAHGRIPGVITSQGKIPGAVASRGAVPGLATSGEPS